MGKTKSGKEFKTKKRPRVRIPESMRGRGTTVKGSGALKRMYKTNKVPGK